MTNSGKVSACPSLDQGHSTALIELVSVNETESVFERQKRSKVVENFGEEEKERERRSVSLVRVCW
jgi:hypothetical protein